MSDRRKGRRRAVDLAPSTRAAYETVLKRAFGGIDPSKWGDAKALPNSTKRILSAAIRSRCAELKTDDSFSERIEIAAERQRKVRIPSDEDVRAYEIATESLSPAKRALALIPLLEGLRARELLDLPREEVKRALKTGELIIVRKGGDEHVLPVDHIRDHLRALLAAPKCHRKRLGERPHKPEQWDVVGEILSVGQPITRYHGLHRLIRRVSKKSLRPHLLRHVFASRMSADNAPLFTIQAALGHKQIATTAKYVHASVREIAKYTRKNNPSER